MLLESAASTLFAALSWGSTREAGGERSLCGDPSAAPTVVVAGQFSEEKTKPFTAADIRYTVKGGVLYAMTLGKPETGMLTLTSVKQGGVARVEVVGTPAPLSFKQDGDGLHIALPPEASHAYGVALKVTGTREI